MQRPHLLTMVRIQHFQHVLRLCFRTFFHAEVEQFHATVTVQP